MRSEEQLLTRRARLLATPPAPVVRRSEPHVIFRLGQHQLGVPADQVRHVTRAVPVTPVPDAPTALRGIVSVMGELVPVADLGALLEAAEVGEQHHLLVVEDAAEGLGLLVSEVQDVVSLDLSDDEASQIPPRIGPHTTATLGGVRLLSLDSLLTDPRLTSAPTSPDPAGDPYR